MTWRCTVAKPHSACVRMLHCFSHVQLFAILGMIACQFPLAMGFSRQEYWSGFPALFQGIFLTQGSSMSPALAGGFFATSTTWEAQTSGNFQANPHQEEKYRDGLVAHELWGPYLIGRRSLKLLLLKVKENILSKPSNWRKGV